MLNYMEELPHFQIYSEGKKCVNCENMQMCVLAVHMIRRLSSTLKQAPVVFVSTSVNILSLSLLGTPSWSNPANPIWRLFVEYVLGVIQLGQCSYRQED